MSTSARGVYGVAGILFFFSFFSRFFHSVFVLQQQSRGKGTDGCVLFSTTGLSGGDGLAWSRASTAARSSCSLYGNWSACSDAAGVVWLSGEALLDMCFFGAGRRLGSDDWGLFLLVFRLLLYVVR